MGMMRMKRKDISRRDFIKVTLGMFMGAAASGCSLSDLKNPKTMVKTPIRTNILRPPGAVTEEHFAQKCIRCGRCGEVCPYHCIKYFDIREGVFAGTPYISVLDIPCYLCMKCVYVCPTGSLVPCEQDEVRMGVAVINKRACVSWQEQETGLMCKTCFNVCPFAGKAIKFHDFKPYIIEEHCTGCGLCAFACIADTYYDRKAIRIEPIRWKKEVKVELKVPGARG